MVKNVKFIKFPFKHLNIFEISSIEVISFECSMVDTFLTEIFNELFSKKYFFSYHIDLTLNFNFQNIETYIQRQNHYSNWLFYANKNLQRVVNNEKCKEWAIPLIKG